jgi:cysteine desulfurase family protein (TIGR01976 family)
MTLDIDFIRAQFPAFEQASLKGQAFFENAGGSYTCRQVVDRLTRFYTERKVQPYAPYEASRLGGEEMDEAQTRMAQMLGVSTQEVSFGPSTTTNTYVLSQAFAQMLKDGDVVIVTNQDHEANTGPWRRLAERGIEIREWAIDPNTGLLDVADLENLLDDNVKLVCFPHCSNIVGAINSVAEICALVRANGAYSCVDGVSYAPHGWPNVDALGADIYMFSAYKTFGPHQGIMVVREGVGRALPNQGHYFNGDNLWQRFTPSGPDHAQVAASAGMADYAEAIYNHHFTQTADLGGKATAIHDLFRDHEEALTQPILDYFGSKNSVRLLGPDTAANRAPTIAVQLHDQSAMDVASELANHGIMTGAGDFYAVRCLKGQNIDPDKGVLRISFVHYTSQQEVDKLLNSLDAVL